MAKCFVTSRFEGQTKREILKTYKGIPLLIKKWFDNTQAFCIGHCFSLYYYCRIAHDACNYDLAFKGKAPSGYNRLVSGLIGNQWRLFKAPVKGFPRIKRHNNENYKTNY